MTPKRKVVGDDIVRTCMKIQELEDKEPLG
nr:MAG TPA: hypothetical protein [Caudoviricetes sp.]